VVRKVTNPTLCNMLLTLATVGIYQGAKAPLPMPGRLSWMEREIRDFVGYLARKLGPALATARKPSLAQEELR
jgi:hypothetical protein